MDEGRRRSLEGTELLAQSRNSLLGRLAAFALSQVFVFSKCVDQTAGTIIAQHVTEGDKHVVGAYTSAPRDPPRPRREPALEAEHATASTRHFVAAG